MDDIVSAAAERDILQELVLHRTGYIVVDYGEPDIVGHQVIWHLAQSQSRRGGGGECPTFELLVAFQQSRGEALGAGRLRGRRREVG